LVDVILYMRHGTPHPPHLTRSGGSVRVSSVSFPKKKGDISNVRTRERRDKRRGGKNIASKLLYMK